MPAAFLRKKEKRRMLSHPTPTYSKAQEIMRQRTRPHSSIPLNSKGKSLLVGNIFCAHCGNRLTLTTSGKRMKRANGEIYYEPRIRYQCRYNVRHPGECDGQSGYSATKLDSIVDQVIRMMFSEIKASPESEILAGQHEKEIELARIRLEKAIEVLREKEKDLKDYQNETLKVIRGQSKLSIDLLNTMVADTEMEIKTAQSIVDAAEHSYPEQKASAENLRSEYDQLLTWADLYDKSSFEAKKMIVAQFIKAVYVGRDYNIEIEFNVTFEEFQSYCMDAEHAERKAGYVRSPHKKVREKYQNCTFPELGGDEEDRTLDLTDANRTLSQVVRKAGLFSYPQNQHFFFRDANHAMEGTRAVRNFSHLWAVSRDARNYGTPSSESSCI